MSVNDGQAWGWIGGAIGSAVTAFMGSLGYILSLWWKNKGQERAVQFSEQSRIIDRQEKQIARLEAQVKEQQETIEELRDIVGMLREDMIRAGLNPRDTNADFIAKTTEQTTKLLVKTDEKLLGDSPGGGHAGADS